MEQIKQYIINRPWLLGLIALPFAALLTWMAKPPQSPAEAQRDPQDWSMDTLIPPGMVLVPLQIQNSENLDSLIGKYAQVDIFTSASAMRFKRPIARGVKLLRAPRNPESFGVLTTESLAPTLVALEHPVYIAIHNPNHLGTKLEKNEQKPRYRRVISEEI